MDDREPVEQLDHEIDRRLTGRSERWRAALPPAADPAQAVRRSRPRALVPALAALATATVLATVWAVGARGPAPRPEPRTPDTVVPWAPLPATHPTFPQRDSTDDQAEAKTTRACTVDDVRVGRPSMDAAAGTAYLSVELQLATTSPCHLLGRPGVVPLGPDGDPIDVAVQDDPAGVPEAVLVSSTRSAVVVVSWAPTHYCEEVDNARLRITLPDQGGEFTVAGFGTTTCNPGEGRPPMRVRPIQQATDDTPRSPWEDVTASGDLDVSVAVGDPIDFTVTLTSPVDLPLQPCPDYSMLVGSRTDTWALNCAAVPSRDDAGVPSLPAGVPVTFAMHADGLADPIYSPKFLWVLDAPGHPTAAGILQVGDATPPDSRITGFVTMDGGPGPGTSIKVTSGTVHVVGDGVDVSADIEGAQFSVSVPAGTYRIWATTPQYQDGTAPCPPVEQDTNADGEVVVAPGANVELRISCQMK